MDFIDDLPESTEQERFQRHNRFLRSLKSDTLLIIDNFNVTATQDSFLSVVLKYRCQILFTTRSKLDEYCTLPLKEIEDMNALFQLTSVFYTSDCQLCNVPDRTAGTRKRHLRIAKIIRHHQGIPFR